MTLETASGLYLCDYHLHTEFSFDGSGTVDDYCRNALDCGLTEIGFSEHVGIDPSDDAYGTLDYEGYAAEVAHAREKYAGRLEVRLGVEIDFRSNVITETADYLEAHDFDYVIGGLHYLEGLMILRTTPFEQREWRAVWDDYFIEMQKLVGCGLFDIVAHFDVAKRGHVPLHGNFDWRTFEEQIASILKQIVKERISLEINTAGLRKQADEIFPSAGILKLYKSLGGELVTYGSDSHSPGKVGCDLIQGARAALDAGLDKVALFSGRKVSTVPLQIQA